MGLSMKSSINKSELEKESKSCHFLYNDILNFSSKSISLQSILNRQIIPTLLQISILRTIGRFIFKRNYDAKTVTKIPSVEAKNDVLNLQLGEWVEVNSIEDIRATLDEKGKFKGLFFMPGMKQFCGKKFKVYKKVEKIKLESTGEMRILRSPTVFLDGVHCDGKLYEGCDRSCFFFWREVWLKRVNS